MPGLSSDPVKRRRQLDGLARGAERRAETLKRMRDDLPDDASHEDAPLSDADAEPRSEPRTEPRSEPGTIGRGSYGDLPRSQRRSEPRTGEGTAHDPEPIELDLEAEAEDERDDLAGDEPGALTRVLGGVFGVS